MSLDTYEVASKIRAVAAIFDTSENFEMHEHEAHGVFCLLNEIADEIEPRENPDSEIQ